MKGRDSDPTIEFVHTPNSDTPSPVLKELRTRSDSKPEPLDPQTLEGKLYVEIEPEPQTETSKDPVEIVSLETLSYPNSPLKPSVLTEHSHSHSTGSTTETTKNDDGKKKRISLDKISVTRIFEYTQDLKQLEMERPS